MFRKIISLAALLLLSVAGFQVARAQSDERKFELGGQFSLLHLSTRTVTTTTLPCLVPPCTVAITSAYGRESEQGFGGRLGYNFSRYFALEAEGNFFPRERPSIGRKVQGLFGAKVGKRSEKFGLFAKARPGFIRFSKGDIKQVLSEGPLSFADFPQVSKTNLAFDLGGVAEWYPSKNIILRFDAGDTFIRFGTRNLVGIDLGGPTDLTIVTTAVETRHHFQASVGVGFRF